MRMRLGFLWVLMIAPALVETWGCAGDPEPAGRRAVFNEHLKSGSLSLTIIGDYFHHSYILELARIAQSLSPRARQIIVCTKKYETALTPYLRANGVSGVDFFAVDASSPIREQWARDIALAGDFAGERIVLVPPDKHASSLADAEAFGRFLQRVLPDRDVRVTPFVFEAGNLAFVSAPERQVLIIGKKVIFDNEVYMRRPWSPGYDEPSLLRAIKTTFLVDTVMVVGRAETRPPTRLYFEYHIDMGIVILRGNRAVVSQLFVDDGDLAALERAIFDNHPVIAHFRSLGSESRQLFDLLAERLRLVAQEYEDYASLLSSLGLEVHRSTVSWDNVLASMSWTNVIQAGDRILLPFYPDSLLGVTTGLAENGGRLKVTLDVSRIEKERFDLTGGNRKNYDLYRSLGYEVETVPEYLHYMMGGVHCFVNIME